MFIGVLALFRPFTTDNAGNISKTRRYSTQACSCCGAISANSPKGRAGLRIREWTCCECGTAHDSDVNAVKNILAAGHCRLAAGISVL
ncbi:zinc ribbon domain-containing protein [Klebsiella michiganensis]|uniref:zinc ribbon domain-containing protein n=1 Tax=Klebsiella michiganensis TaxID=1134687 RepID=UPI002658024A|nr:zinc ribbon domain-containing protein [Klebsiella michiganensis]WKK00845.1 zinc ribbon domain-containing protein [Klebsiella michiganensis]WKK06768.1 zinc ribbon domain-containing protein [Klebsiella michiganensis]